MGWYRNQMARHEAAKARKVGRVDGGDEFVGVWVGGGYIVYEGRRYPAAGVVAVVESVGELNVRDRSRVSVTRMAFLGPLALAVPKRRKVTEDSREVYLTVTGDEFQFVVPVPADKGLEARQFAAVINTAVAR